MNLWHHAVHEQHKRFLAAMVLGMLILIGGIIGLVAYIYVKLG